MDCFNESDMDKSLLHNSKIESNSQKEIFTIDKLKELIHICEENGYEIMKYTRKPLKAKLIDLDKKIMFVEYKENKWIMNI